MATAEKAVRQSVTLPPRTAKPVMALAQSRKTSADRILVDLIDAGSESQQFSDLVERLASASDPAERKRLKDELARITFDE